MVLAKDKIYHMIVCFTLTIIFSFGVKDIMIFKPLFSSLMSFGFFTTFKETINDLIYKNGCFDVDDIKANAIGSILGGVFLCIVYVLQYVF